MGADETCYFVTAVHNLREHLDPCNKFKVMAGQDFSRTVQGDGETVADNVCHLEKAFCVTSGSDDV